MDEFERQKRILETIKRCQRNWEHIDIPEQHIDHFIHIATNSPSKQYEAYFNLYVITNQDMIKDLLEYTWGFTHNINAQTSTSEVPVSVRNPQVGASAYMLWTQKFPENTLRNFEYDGVNKDNQVFTRRDNAFTSIGISMALVSYSAASLGYETAYNKNHNKPGKEGYWEDTLGINPDVEEIAFGLGIGRAQKDRPHYESDETHMMVGWPNPEIIDIRNTREYTYNDKTYSVMREITYPSFSVKERSIQLKRFD